MQLEGNLNQLSLRELIEMITYASVKGMLEVRVPGLVAQLYFSDGQPCHAAAGDLRGKALQRARAALRTVRRPQPFDRKAALRDFEVIASR